MLPARGAERGRVGTEPRDDALVTTRGETASVSLTSASTAAVPSVGAASATSSAVAS